MLLALCLIALDAPPAPEILLRGEAATELAPHGEGNVYAPDVHEDGPRLRMWYGGQGRDGHDRIHLAESGGGHRWERKGVVLEDPTANHVNDPSVVKVDGVYYLYYSRAAEGIRDEIALATSRDGVRWDKQGTVLKPGAPGEWDGLLVGRPSVLHEDGLFRMWYDGRKDLLPGPLAGKAPTSPHSRRAVGLATSKDGRTWTKHPANPVFGNDAGGVDVKKVRGRYLMVYESHEGTRLAEGPDGVRWRDRGLAWPKSDTPADRHGHVTPMLLPMPEPIDPLLFIGAARAGSWDRNQIGMIVDRWPLSKP